jgi:hypothetical protein
MVLIGMACGSLGRKILVKSLARSFGPRSVDLSTIKPLTLVRIRKEIVSARNLFKALLRLLVSGIEVGVQLLGQAPVRLPNVVGRGGARDPQDFVWVFHCPSVETDVDDRRVAD